MQKLRFWGLLGLLGAAGAIGGWWFGPDFSDPVDQSGYRTQVPWAPIAETIVILGVVAAVFLKNPNSLFFWRVTTPDKTRVLLRRPKTDWLIVGSIMVITFGAAARDIAASGDELWLLVLIVGFGLSYSIPRFLNYVRHEPMLVGHYRSFSFDNSSVVRPNDRDYRKDGILAVFHVILFGLFWFYALWFIFVPVL